MATYSSYSVDMMRRDGGLVSRSRSHKNKVITLMLKRLTTKNILNYSSSGFFFFFHILHFTSLGSF